MLREQREKAPSCPRESPLEGCSSQPGICPKWRGREGSNLLCYWEKGKERWRGKREEKEVRGAKTGREERKERRVVLQLRLAKKSNRERPGPPAPLGASEAARTVIPFPEPRRFPQTMTSPGAGGGWQRGDFPGRAAIGRSKAAPGWRGRGLAAPPGTRAASWAGEGGGGRGRARGGPGRGPPILWPPLAAGGRASPGLALASSPLELEPRRS